MGNGVVPMSKVQSHIESQRKQYEEELFEFLAIPSVSAQTKHDGDVARAADWVLKQLTQAGLTAELIKTNGHPLVYAEWLGAKGAPTILFYGHYDVQPPEPLDLWHSPPFEPTVRDGNVYARGATDDKGQMFTHIKAVEAWRRTEGALPTNVKFLIEGEEEVGSQAITSYLKSNREKLKCDQVVVSDSSQLAPGAPAITYGLRGLAYFEIRVQGPARDLHSGTFGGSVRNPGIALAKILASLIDDEGRIQVPGFYDDVRPLTDDERREFRRLPFDTERYRKELHVSALAGEAGFSTLERKWARPTCDIHGLMGGYQGEGAKTVLPAFAAAKVSFRLVPNQHPGVIAESFREHVSRHTPSGVTSSVTTFQGSEAVLVPWEGEGFRAAVRAIEAGFGTPPVFIREGGSIPIVLDFKRQLDVDSLLLGWGLPDDNAHAPNEKFHLADFHRGIQTTARLLQELSLPSNDRKEA